MMNLFLEDLESRIDDEAESRIDDEAESRTDDEAESNLMQSWIDFSGNGNQEGPFTPRRTSKSPPGILWPAININTAIAG